MFAFPKQPTIIAARAAARERCQTELSCRVNRDRGGELQAAKMMPEQKIESAGAHLRRYESALKVGSMVGEILPINRWATAP